MLATASAVFGLGAAQKAPCATQAWVERREGNPFVCDSDIPNLYLWEQFAHGRLPYVDGCRPAERPCDEYPVLSIFAMRGVAWVTGDSGSPYPRFFVGTLLVLLVCTLTIVWSLERCGARTILFAASPVLALAGTANWDLLPVALMSVGMVQAFRHEDGLAGLFFGLGGAVKLFPGLVALPFAAERLRTSFKARAGRLVGWTAGTWLVWNIPFAIWAFDGWMVFFRFNARRFPDFDSLWHVLCWIGLCPSTGIINVVSLAITAAATAVMWYLVTRRRPELPRWILGFPLLVLLLLPSKVWSPQYSLWLLPWFAFTRIRRITFVQYQLAEVAEFILRYSFFGTLNGGEGVPYAPLAFVIVLRSALLVRCLLEWTRDPEPIATPAADGMRVTGRHPSTSGQATLSTPGSGD